VPRSSRGRSSTRNPDQSALALARIEAAISPVQAGMSLPIKWRGKPVFFRNRTKKEIAAARAVALADLKAP
jgi:ubiquinol-cytochrome c reductase iron-sulfur subunit